MTAKKLDRTAAYWGGQPTWDQGGGRFWLELPQIQQRLCAKVSDRQDMDWVAYTLRRHLADRLPMARCLSLGCGQGALERRLAALGAFTQCDAIDIAETSVTKAASLARQAGYHHITYRVEDVNRIVLRQNTYDVIWASGAVHHFEDLENVFRQAAAALKQNGLLVLNEYVGASRFQFAPRQREIIEACHALLPARYRTLTAAFTDHPAALGRDNWRWWVRRLADKVRDGDLVGAVQRHARRLWDRRRGQATVRTTVDLPTAQSVATIDPSEAIRAAEIVPVLRQYFEIVEYKPMGGSILQFLLADIAGNFVDEDGRKLLDMLFTIEDTLMAVGDLGSDFAYIVAAPKPAQG